MKAFFTTYQTQPPAIPFYLYVLMLFFLLFFIYTSLKYYRYPLYSKTFKIIQGIQLFFLYSWYLLSAIPLSNSLPLYHCRLAMFALLFLPDKSRFKQYFALMGASGALFALGYPVFDPYDFPHITGFSFLLGHYCLLVNSLVYLMNYYDKQLLEKYRIILLTFSLDLLLVGVNQLTGGNYGLMTHPPFIKGENIFFNYLAVSTILSAALLALDEYFKKYWNKKADLI
ncbi:TIGR02206 family membrane protein [Streptococcus macacae]|uniref:TIGR02206 family protein n=1 Tax=Streptococcus macacae NCTC 11558 TaxID=764298 RepID=G5JVU8_9STRE|nr:TIGR02206 family membrane protein [Streptococcus macacae]EHJ52072.1 TIGR02206 family protein [Streptococcus macacae NCTC 11558]SUN78938.1 major facilitator superfamily permease [Streptococcus macacae NCTC 11558]